MLGSGVVIGVAPDDEESPESGKADGKPPAGFSGSVLTAFPGLSDKQVQAVYEAICLVCGKEYAE
jgi:hypothetical protein